MTMFDIDKQGQLDRNTIPKDDLPRTIHKNGTCAFLQQVKL